MNLFVFGWTNKVINSYFSTDLQLSYNIYHIIILYHIEMFYLNVPVNPKCLVDFVTGIKMGSIGRMRVASKNSTCQKYKWHYSNSNRKMITTYSILCILSQINILFCILFHLNTKSSIISPKISPPLCPPMVTSVPPIIVCPFSVPPSLGRGRHRANCGPGPEVRTRDFSHDSRIIFCPTGDRDGR